MKKQMTLSMYEDELKKVKTRKKEFLETMNKMIPWEEWKRIITPCYYEGKKGNKPYELELMLRLYVLQNLYDLSDEATATEVIDSRAFSEFCDVDSSNQVPDAETIRRFRNILANNNLTEKLFENVVGILTEKGLILKKGTIVDSTIIKSPSSTKNKEKRRDKEAKSTKKGNAYFFGYKAHIGVDKETGLIHTNKITPANEHDVTITSQLLTGDEIEVYGDSGYIGADKRDDAITKNNDNQKIKYIINRRPSSMKKLTKNGQYKAKKREKIKSSIRSKVEHPFYILKRIFKFRKTRYKTLRKQISKLNFMFALVNLYLVDNRKLSA